MTPTLRLSASFLVQQHNQIVARPTRNIYNFRATKGTPELNPFDAIKGLSLEKRGAQVLTLDLSGAPITKDDLSEIVELCPNMSMLSLAKCAKLDELSKNFSSLKTLKWLDISGTGVTKLDDSFTMLKTLEVFIAYMTPLEALPKDFSSLSSLRDLVLAYNPMETLPPSFGNLKKLDRLVIQSTCLSELPPMFGKLDFRALVLENNSLLKSLPKYLMWKKLIYLSLDGTPTRTPARYAKYTKADVLWNEERRPGPFSERHLPLLDLPSNRQSPIPKSKSVPPSGKGRVSTLSPLLASKSMLPNSAPSPSLSKALRTRN